MSAAATTELTTLPRSPSLPTFFDNLDSFAEAPEGVAKLRELILDLAVRGKLVEQDDNDEPASVLIDTIRRWQEKRVSSKRSRKQDHIECDVSLFPYEAPSGWEVFAFGALVEIVRGITFPSSAKSRIIEPTTVACLRTTNVQHEVDWDDLIYVSSDYVKRDDQWIENGDILISMANSYELVGKVSQVVDPKIKATFGGFIGVIRSHGIDSRFLLFTLRSRYMQGTMRRSSSQTTNIANISLAGIRPIPLPLPPLAEQRRIVSKVDQLMSLCDELESRCTERVRVRKRASRSCLDRLVRSSSRGDLESAWQRLSDHFAVLYDTPETLTHLRQSILQLAVQGKLVPKDPNDEPAATLYSNIQDEKAQRQSKGIDKKTKPLPPIGDEEKPFGLPGEWEWSRLCDLVYLLGDGLHGTPEYEKGTEFHFVNGNNLIDGRIVIKPNTKTVSLEAMRKHAKRLTSNTVLVSINGTLGKVAFYNNEQIVLGKSACYFNLSDSIEKHYIRLLLECPYFMDYALANATGSTIKNLGLKAMNAFPVPLPPLAEQKRIVAKVDQLLSHCDELSARLGERQFGTQQLLAATIHQLLNQASGGSK